MQRQRELIERYSSPLLSLTVNFPGLDKLTKDAQIIFECALIEIKKANLKIIHTEQYSMPSGFEAQIVVDEDAKRLKKTVLQIENTHVLGRFMDIDVLDIDKMQISREDVDIPPRRCFLCENDARLCARSAKHPLHELLSFIHDKVLKYNED